MLVVTKFGGSSLASAEQFKKVKGIVEADPVRKIVVVSAIGKRNKADSKITDLLYLLHAHLNYSVPYDNILNMIEERYLEVEKELGIDSNIQAEFNKLRTELNRDISLDYLVSRGEYLAARLMSKYLGFDFLDAKDLICFNYDGTINNEKTDENINKLYKGDTCVVIPGFYGAYPNGVVKLLSRGGSDITGSIVAKALNASKYENWTDVSGFLMADPRIIDNPRRIKEITYNELRELSYMGANVLHEETVFPVQELNIPINIRNTNCPSDPGTIITDNCGDNDSIITGISGKKNFTSFTVTRQHGVRKISLVRQVLNVFDKYNCDVEHLPTSIDSFSIVVESGAVEKCIYDLVNEIKAIKDVKNVEVDSEIALVAVVGRNLKSRHGISGKLFAVIGNNNINIKMIAQGSQELSIILGISNNDFEAAIRTIYENF